MYEDIIKAAAARGHGLGSEQLEPIIGHAIAMAVQQSAAPLVPAPKPATDLRPQLEAAEKEIAKLNDINRLLKNERDHLISQITKQPEPKHTVPLVKPAPKPQPKHVAKRK